MKLGITGYPLTYTQSPQLHLSFLKKARMNGSYDVLPFNPIRGKREFFRFLDQKAKQGYRGLNVTVPLKEWAYQYAVKKGVSAGVVGAVNTLVFENARLSAAANTDSVGFWDDVGAWIKRGTFNITVVGTGGAARGILAGTLAKHDVAARVNDIQVWGRDPRKVKKLRRQLKIKPSKKLKSPSTLIIWCLPPVSSREAKLIWKEITSDLTSKTIRLYDLNYSTRANCTKALVAERTRRTGEGMLKRQAKASFDLWIQL